MTKGPDKTKAKQRGHKKPGRQKPGNQKAGQGAPTPEGEGEEIQISGVRIIGGTFRGRQLQYSGDLRTRPMKDRTREAIFNLVGVDVIGRHAFDLFAGTGALALEAMSRGAAKATLVERHLPTRNLIEDNIRALGLEDKATAVFSDSFMFVRKLQPDEQGTSWMVFCSPPYDLFVDRQADMLAMIEGIITKMPQLNGEPIRNFKALREQVVRYRPGDQIPLTIERGGEVLETTATLIARNQLIQPPDQAKDD